MKSNGNAKVKVKTSIAQKKENFTGALFIAPYLIGYVIFQGLPFLIAVVLGFTNVRYISKLEDASFVGINNFIRMFTDVDTMKALGRTGLYSLMYVPLIIVFKLRLGPDGPVVYILSALGSENPPYLLYGLNTALPTVVCIAVWKGIGLNFITYLAALQNVSADLLEAAQIDGASKWQRIKNIVIPMISPTTFFLMISSVITSLQNFTTIQALTGGGPGQATTVMSINIIRTAFTNDQTGYAGAQALVMFIIVLIITLIQWRGQQKWVNY